MFDYGKELETIKSFLYEKCYCGDLAMVKKIVNENLESTLFLNMVCDIETHFYIINGIGTTKQKQDIMIFLKTCTPFDLNKNMGYALEMSVQKNDINLVNFLIHNGVKMEPGEDGILLYCAAEKNNYDMFFLLVNNGVELTADVITDIKELPLQGTLKYFFDRC